MSGRSVSELFRNTFRAFQEDDAGRMVAALAFYITLSVVPLGMFSLLVLGRLFGEEAARDKVFLALKTVLGVPAAQTVQDLVLAAADGRAGLGISLFGIMILLFAASAMFQQMRRSLNRIWRLPARHKRIRAEVLHQWIALMITLLVQVLMVVILFAGTLVAAFMPVVARVLHGRADTLLQVADFGLSSLGVILLVVLVYRLLPRGRLPWSSVWTGAVVTALLFLVGKELFRLYLRYSPTTNIYGAAGSLLMLLLWVFYLGGIFYLGAEFTGVHAGRRPPKKAPADR